MNVGTIIRAVTDLPARLFGGNAQKVEVSGLDYTLHLDLEKLPPADAGDATGKWTVVWDEVTDTYRRVEFTDLPPPAGVNDETIDDRVAELIKAGNNVAIVYDDPGNRLTIHSIAPGGSTGPQNLFDTIHDAQLAIVPAAVKTITLSGYNRPGDAGPAMPCRRTAGPVTLHNGWFRTTDRYTDAGGVDATNGGYWEYVGNNQPIWIEWFGGKGDYYQTPQDGSAISSVNPTPTDNHAAIMSALEFIYYHTSGGIVNPPHIAAGPTVQIGGGGYYVSDSIVADRSFVMQGLGHGYYHEASQSRLIFAAGKMGFKATSYLQSVPGSQFHLRDLFLYCLGWGGHTDQPGIRMKFPALIEHCTIEGFGGHGIEIAADVGEGSNANGFCIYHCVIIGNNGSGIYTLGGDANAGGGSFLNIMNNQGWGIEDRGQLGNTWMSVHTQGNVLGPYYGIGGGSRSVFLGCYSESDQPPSVINRPSHAIGGIHAAGVQGSGTHFIEDFLTAVYLRVDGNVTSEAIQVRTRPVADRILSITTNADGFTYYWMYRPDVGIFQFQTNEFADWLAFYWTGHLTTLTNGRAETIGQDQFHSPHGIFLGGPRFASHNDCRYLGYNDPGYWYGLSGGTAIHKPGTYALGDSFINFNPTGYDTGENWGWSVTTAGGYAPPWVSGTTYGAGDLAYVKNTAGRYYKLVTAGGGTSTIEPIHVSGENAPGADGYVWRWLTNTSAVIKRCAPIMGNGTVTANDPILNLRQIWDNAAVAFVGNRTNITDTASHTDSMLEEWCVGGTRKASIRKDGVILSNGVPVVMLHELDELRDTVADLRARIEALEAPPP